MNTSSNEAYDIAHRIEGVQENSPDSTIEAQQNEAYAIIDKRGGEEGLETVL